MKQLSPTDQLSRAQSWPGTPDSGAGSGGRFAGQVAGPGDSPESSDLTSPGEYQ